MQLQFGNKWIFNIVVSYILFKIFNFFKIYLFILPHPNDSGDTVGVVEVNISKQQ